MLENMCLSLATYCTRPLSIVYSTRRLVRGGDRTCIPMTYWNELSSFFFSCGDGAISFSSTFHAFFRFKISDHGRLMARTGGELTYQMWNVA